ncbi:MAG: hypothetical protein JWR69_153 [Pedosphaera sp.]|nr:hypothetical protein [Pedosphaera sp.]
MDSKKWSPVTTRMLIGFVIGCGVFLLLVFKSEPGFVFLIDHANLPFHEAGHLLVGIFSNRLETYGGTLGQLTFPVVLAVSFWRKGDSLSFAGSVIWFFENWLNIARYMADARVQVLPLVGGGDHDWANIFGRWKLMAHDTQIARAVTGMAWLGIAAACAWVVWRWWRDRQDAGARMARCQSAVDHVGMG